MSAVKGIECVHLNINLFSAPLEGKQSTRNTNILVKNCHVSILTLLLECLIWAE